MDIDTAPPVPEGDGTAHPLVGGEPRSFGSQPTTTNGRGLVMPQLGFGTWQLDDSTARWMVERALELGVRHIDTAQMYGNESGVGEAIASSGIDRAELFVTTKIDNANHGPADLVRSVDASLDRLGLDHVDLALIHWPVEWGDIGATLAALTNVQAAGRALHIGVSNFTIAQLDHVVGWAPLEVLQVECHPYLQQRDLRAWCRVNGLVFTAYSPLAQGDVTDDDVLKEIADRHDASPAAVALAWLMHLDGVCAIPRTADPDHLAANWSARALSLTEADMDAIATLEEGRRLVDPDFAPW